MKDSGLALVTGGSGFVSMQHIASTTKWISGNDNEAHLEILTTMICRNFTIIKNTSYECTILI